MRITRASIKRGGGNRVFDPHRIVAVVTLAPALVAGTCAAPAAELDAAADKTAAPQYRWANSPHGAMLERILPPAIDPANLPEPHSPGARLVATYCVQCHHLPNPAMHSAQKWPSVVGRMVWRMQGNGNMGKLMRDMMAEIKAPDAAEQSALVNYLQSNAQQELDVANYQDIHTPAGRRFSIACSQCHVLPDPRRHTAAEWPAVVARMQRNMA